MVDYVAQMPGDRTVILVSPGFLSESEKYPLDEVIDDALRSQVIISSLDPKGPRTAASGSRRIAAVDTRQARNSGPR